MGKTRTPRRRFARAATLGGCALILAACAEVKPIEYTEIHEIKPGPGLLTGESGEFAIHLGDPFSFGAPSETTSPEDRSTE